MSDNAEAVIARINNALEENERLRIENKRLQAVVDAARKAAMELIKEAHAEIHGATIGYGLALGAQKSTAEEILRTLDGGPSPADKLEAWAHQEPGQYSMDAIAEDLAGRDANFRERDGEP